MELGMKATTPEEVHLQEILDELERVCRTAGDEALAMQAGPLERRYKGEQDFATAADDRSQAIIEEALRARFPEVPLVAEEKPAPAISSKTFFVADPIDGTHVYAHGAREWTVTIAYIENNLPCCGVVYQPACGVLMKAAQGSGCWLDSTRVKCSAPDCVSDSVIGLEQHSGYSPEQIQRINTPLSQATLGTRMLSAATAGCLDLLQGVTAAYVNVIGAKIWDFAAAYVGIREAGGAAYALDGSELNWDSIPMDAVFAANEHLARNILGIIANQMAT